MAEYAEFPEIFRATSFRALRPKLPIRGFQNQFLHGATDEASSVISTLGQGEFGLMHAIGRPTLVWTIDNARLIGFADWPNTSPRPNQQRKGSLSSTSPWWFITITLPL